MSVWVKPWEISDHLCECGCGEYTLLATKTVAVKGWVEGEPLRFLRGHGSRFHAKRRREMFPEGSPSERLCACGCGGVTPYDARARPRRLIPGHRCPVPVQPKQLQFGAQSLRPDPLLKYRVDENGCWVWAGSVDKSGYPKYSSGPRLKTKAHRASYERHKGPIPPGFHIHHECRNPLCVNPAHLTALSPDDHTLEHLLERMGPERILERVQDAA